MSAKVIEFIRTKAPAKKRQPDLAPVKQLLTIQQIFNDCYEDLITDWQAAAAKNSLNEFIRAKLPKFARDADILADYVNDINVIAGVERRLDIKVAIFYPGCTPNNPYGWLVAFHRGNDVFSTPPDMAAEANARALNVLLFLKLEDQLKKLGRG